LKDNPIYPFRGNRKIDLVRIEILNSIQYYYLEKGDGFLKRKIPIAKPMIDIGVLERIRGVLESGQLIQGPLVREFEESFSDFNGVREAVAVNSGTAALQVSLAALGLKAGDEVITTPLTFAATSNSVLSLGGIPVFVDVDPETYNMDADRLEEAITEKTRGIIPVHLFGLPCEMDKILEIAERHDLFVLEDAAQAIGAKYHGKLVGSFGGAAIYSFYATKNLTTGEGGMIVTDDSAVAERARQIRDQGQDGKYHHVILGYNFRMTEIAAAIGLDQLEIIDELNEVRRGNASYLGSVLDQIEGIDPPFVPEESRHVYHLYAAKLDPPSLGCSRDEALTILNRMGIDARPPYPLPLYKQPLYLDLDNPDRNPLAPLFSQISYLDTSCPVSELLAKTLMLLPVHPNLSEDDLTTIKQGLETI